MGSGDTDTGGVLVALLFVGAWLVPIVLTVWLFRMLSAMTAAQREIASHLARIEQHVRAAASRDIA